MDCVSSWIMLLSFEPTFSAWLPACCAGHPNHHGRAACRGELLLQALQGCMLGCVFAHM